jgi:hypothetical protein
MGRDFACDIRLHECKGPLFIGCRLSHMSFRSWIVRASRYLEDRVE